METSGNTFFKAVLVTTTTPDLLHFLCPPYEFSSPFLKLKSFYLLRTFNNLSRVIFEYKIEKLKHAIETAFRLSLTSSRASITSW